MPADAPVMSALAMPSSLLGAEGKPGWGGGKGRREILLGRFGVGRRGCQTDAMPECEQGGVGALTDLLRGARRAVVFTGAGISTESGIPDFRSPGGIWSKMQPVMFEDYLAKPEARRVSWERRFAMEDTWATVQPNAGHHAVA